MTREERIKYFEKIFDRAALTAQKIESALDAYGDIQADLRELENYYASQEWKDDYDADNAGLISADIKRGVLSQDGVYDLLDKYKELRESIMEAVTKS